MKHTFRNFFIAVDSQNIIYIWWGKKYCCSIRVCVQNYEIAVENVLHNLYLDSLFISNSNQVDVGICC